MPLRYYQNARTHLSVTITPEHLENAFMTLANPIVDWNEVTVGVSKSNEALPTYTLSPQYQRRLSALNKFIGDLDLYTPTVFFSKYDITRDLAYVFFRRYFIQLRKTAIAEGKKPRYPNGFDCKSLTFIQDVFNKNRSSENNDTGPADATYATEQDLSSEAFLWYGGCSNSGFSWSGPFESFMEGRTAPVSMSPSVDYPLATWGLMIGTRSDAANNTSEKGMPRLLSYLENKRNSAGWLVIDLNQSLGYSEMIKAVGESKVPKREVGQVLEDMDTLDTLKEKRESATQSQVVAPKKKPVPSSGKQSLTSIY